MRCIYCQQPARLVATFIGGAICPKCLAIIYDRPYPTEASLRVHPAKTYELLPGIFVMSRLVVERWTEAGKECQLWAKYEGAGATPEQAFAKLCERLKAGIDPESGPDAAQTWVTPLR